LGGDLGICAQPSYGANLPRALRLRRKRTEQKRASAKRHERTPIHHRITSSTNGDPAILPLLG
jgi:hypothetical protein